MTSDWASWFRHQLQASADGFVWGAEQLEPAYHFALPPEPSYLGTWEPARHVWHVAEYEPCLAVPTMRQWLGGPLPPEDAWPDDEDSWTLTRGQPMSHTVAFYRSLGCQVIAEPDPELFALEPEDSHFVCRL